MNPKKAGKLLLRSEFVARDIAEDEYKRTAWGSNRRVDPRFYSMTIDVSSFTPAHQEQMKADLEYLLTRECRFLKISPMRMGKATSTMPNQKYLYVGFDRISGARRYREKWMVCKYLRTMWPRKFKLGKEWPEWLSLSSR